MRRRPGSLDLHNIRTPHAPLNNAHFPKADLTGANLRGANLTRAALLDVDLFGADLRGVKGGPGKDEIRRIARTDQNTRW